MFTRFLKTAISISNSIYKSNLSTCIIDMENVEPFIFGDAFLNFVWFETFACTPFFDFGHFQSIFTTGKNHFTNNIVNSTGCSNSICAKVNTYQAVKNALLSHKNCICTFMRCGHWTYDTWIWLKMTSLSSTASVLKECQRSIKQWIYDHLFHIDRPGQVILLPG